LESLYRKYASQGFVVLGFPCNQFGKQEPGTNEQIKEFVSKLDPPVTFPIFDKVEVNGEGAHPVFIFLKKQLPGLLGSEFIKWNFTKFLVDRNGVPYKRYGPKDEPFSIEDDIKALLAQK
jgi:glutathione peroxidase